MNIDDRRELTRSGKSGADKSCYAFENLFHHSCMKHTATVLFLSTSGLSDLYALKCITAHRQSRRPTSSSSPAKRVR